jgi:hypothetical protein
MYSSYCKDNNKCDSASNAPKCPLNNGVSIVQKIIVKISNTSTTFFSQQTDPDISIKGGGGVNKKKIIFQCNLFYEKSKDTET